MKMDIKNETFYVVVFKNEVCFADEPPAMAIYSTTQQAISLKDKLESIFYTNKYEVKKVRLRVID